MDYNLSKTALITGATSGIGAAYARMFASKGYNLVITGRRVEKINSLADELVKTYNVKIEVIIVELSSYQELDILIQKIKNKSIDVLVNNAGFAAWELFYKDNFESHENMINVHILTTLKIIHTILPNMIVRGSGVIINVASLAAISLLPRSSIYCGTKAFLKHFSETIHTELMGSGVKIQVLCPGFTRTDVFREWGIDTSKAKNKGVLFTWMNSDEVVEISLKCLNKNKVVCIPGFWNKVLITLTKMCPRPLYYRMVRLSLPEKMESKLFY